MKKFFVIYMIYVFSIVIFINICCGCMNVNRVKKDEATDIMKLNNFTFNGTPYEISIVNVPQRTIVCGNSAIDTLIALGVGDNIIGAVLSDGFSRNQYGEMLSGAYIFTNPLSKEAALMLKPDFILGWRRFFGDKRLGNTVFWNENGIPAYIQDASGPIPNLGNFPPCTIESEINFISNMGKVFKQEQKAQSIVKNIEIELGKISPLNKNIKKPRVLVVEFMARNIEIFGRNLLSGDIVTKLGGEIIDIGYPFISKEELLFTDADVIFVVYNGGNIEKENAIAQMNAKIFQKIKAVKEQRVYPLHYEKIVAPGVNTVETITIIRNGIYGNKVFDINNK